MGRVGRLFDSVAQLESHCMDGIKRITAWLDNTTRISPLASVGRSRVVPDIQGDGRVYLHLIRVLLC